VPGLGVVLRSVRRRGRQRRQSGHRHTCLRHPTCPSVRGSSQFFFTGLPDPRGLPFGPGHRLVSDELWDAAEVSASFSSGLSPRRRSLLGSSCPAGGLVLRYLRLTGIAPGLQRGFHVPLPQDATGVGSLLIPGPTVSSPFGANPPGSSCALPRQGLLPPTAHHRRGTGVTRFRQGFILISPSGLPLTCCGSMAMPLLGLRFRLHTSPLPATHAEVDGPWTLVRDDLLMTFFPPAGHPLGWSDFVSQGRSPIGASPIPACRTGPAGVHRSRSPV
jgi:hypothetical protein